MAVISYTPEFMLFIEKLDAISQISTWEKWGIIFSGLSSILAVIMASFSFYNSLRCNWVKIKTVTPLLYINDSHDKINNIGIQIESSYKTDIKIIFDIIYIKLSDNIMLGFKAINSDKDIIKYRQEFELIRTYGTNDKKYGFPMTMRELYINDLKYTASNGGINKIKKGDIIVITNVGYFKRKLSKNEIKEFIGILSQIIGQEKFG